MIDQEPARIPVISIIRNSFAIPWSKRATMLRALLPISLIMIALRMGDSVILAELGFVAEFVTRILYWMVITVFAVTCHRLILLGDDSVPKYGLRKWSKRESSFVGWSLLGYGGWTLITLLVIIFSVGFTGSLGSLPQAWGGYALYFIAVPGAYVFARFSVLLPATAVDEQRDLTWAWKTTEGNGWRLFLVVGILPFALSYGPDYLPGRLSVVDFVIQAVGLILYVVEVAALSLSYQHLTAHRVLRFGQGRRMW